MRLWLLDMGSLCAWHYFGNPDTADGMLHALDNWLWEFRDSHRPTHVVATFDGANNFRKEIDPEYKLGRKDKSEMFIDQLRRAPQLVADHGFFVAREERFEADDVIASHVARFRWEVDDIWIVSEDKDLLQLVNVGVRQYRPRKAKTYDIDAVTEELGVPPWRVADLLAIAGDSADHIKGIPGIGKTYAVAALKQVQSIGELFLKAANGSLGSLKPKTQQLISAGYDDYLQAYRLVSLRYDMPINHNLDALKVRDNVHKADDSGANAEPQSDVSSSLAGRVQSQEEVVSHASNGNHE